MPTLFSFLTCNTRTHRMICHSAHVRFMCSAVEVDRRRRQSPGLCRLAYRVATPSSDESGREFGLGSGSNNQQVFHSSRALEFADFLSHLGPDRDGTSVESTISKHRRSLREKLKHGDGGVSKQILDSLARKNIDEWKLKLTKLLSDRDERELVSREKKDWRDFNLLSAVATKMGLYCHRYARVVVFSKVPLPNYRPDLDDSRPQREVILPPGMEDEVACLLKAHLSQKSMSRRHLANIFLSRSSNDDGIFANERFFEPQKIFMRKSALEKIHMRKSWDIRLLQREWQESPLGRNMLQFRKTLPMFKERDALIKLIAENQVVIVSGETGCGKTTQLPQYILESDIEAMRGATCSIICTQPRRISAMTVSERVASERGEPIGESVGYKIRLEREIGRETRLLYCTTGILLRKFINDRSLRGVTHVVVDEIHERGMHEDFVLIILKEILPRRPDLKVVLMSATLNAELFASYFGGAPIIHIPGFTHPVKEHFLEDILEETGYRLTPGNQIDNYGPEKMMMRRNSQPQRKNNHLVYPVRGTLKMADFRNCSPKTRVSLSLWNPNAIGFNLIEHVLCNIVKSKQPGAVLVFLTGWEDIKSLKHQLQSNPLLGNRRKVLLLACHSVMSSYEQKLIFEKPANGMRKIVLATNIAETSITIDDIVFVIDCGKAKESSYDALNNIPCLLSSWISKASARQRRGRAGRVQPGECYHLYPRCVYDSFADYQLPEILRTPLESLCLHIKSLQLGSISEFLSKAMQPPEALSVQNAIEYLKIIGALDEKENLTVLGQYLTKLPVEPKLGKMLVLGAIFKCLNPVLVIVASLSLRDPFVAPFDKKDDADLARVEISFRNCSDHLTLVRAFEGWRDAERNFSAQDYCQKNSLSQQTLQSIDSLSRKYFFALADSGLVGDRQSCNIRSHDEYLIRGVICAALFPGVCSVENRTNSVVVKTMEDGQVLISSSSVNAMLRKIPYPWLVFNEKIKVHTVNIRDSTGVSDSLLLLFGGSLSRHEDGHLSMLDGYFDFYMTPGLADLYVSLKKELDEIVQMKLLNPHLEVESYSGVFAAVRLLASQDQCVGKFVVGREKPMPIATGNNGTDDPKTQLQTWLAREGRDPPAFRTKRLDNNQFLSIAVVNGKYFMGKPCSTEVLSENDAAAEALLRLQGKCCSSFVDTNSPRLDLSEDSDSEYHLRRLVNDR